MTRKSETIALFLLITFAFTGYWLTLRPGHAWGGDFSLYILQGLQNLDRYEPYNDLKMIYAGEPMWPKKFPPVYPLILTPVLAQYGVNFELLKIPGILLFCLSLIPVYLIFKRQFSGLYAFIILILIVLLPAFWDFKEHILSDFPFLFFTYWALYFLDSAHNHSRKSILGFITGMTAVYLAYRTRRIGLVFIPSILVFEGIFKQGRKLIFLISSGCLLLVFIFIPSFITELETLSQEFFISDKPLLERVYSSALGFNNVWVLSESHWMEISCFIVLFGFVSAGLALTIQHHCSIKEIFFIIYVLLSAIWPRSQEPRYYFPLVPLVFYYTLVFAEHVWSGRNQVKMLLLAISCLYIAVIVYPVNYCFLDFKNIPRGIHIDTSQAAFDFIRKHTTINDVLLFSKPQVMVLLEQRSSVKASVPMTDSELWKTLDYYNVSHIVVCGDFLPDNLTVKPFVKKYRERFELIFENVDFSIYKVLKKEGIS